MHLKPSSQQHSDELSMDTHKHCNKKKAAIKNLANLNN